MEALDLLRKFADIGYYRDARTAFLNNLDSMLDTYTDNEAKKIRYDCNIIHETYYELSWFCSTCKSINNEGTVCKCKCKKKIRNTGVPLQSVSNHFFCPNPLCSSIEKGTICTKCGNKRLNLPRKKIVKIDEIYEKINKFINMNKEEQLNHLNQLEVKINENNDIETKKMHFDCSILFQLDANSSIERAKFRDFNRNWYCSKCLNIQNYFKKCKCGSLNVKVSDDEGILFQSSDNYWYDVRYNNLKKYTETVRKNGEKLLPNDVLHRMSWEDIEKAKENQILMKKKEEERLLLEIQKKEEAQRILEEKKKEKERKLFEKKKEEEQQQLLIQQQKDEEMRKKAEEEIERRKNTKFATALWVAFCAFMVFYLFTLSGIHPGERYIIRTVGGGHVYSNPHLRLNRQGEIRRDRQGTPRVFLDAQWVPGAGTQGNAGMGEFFMLLVSIVVYLIAIGIMLGTAVLTTVTKQIGIFGIPLFAAVFGLTHFLIMRTWVSTGIIIFIFIAILIIASIFFQRIKNEK